MTPTKLTGAEKEAQIMKEIRLNQTKYETKFAGSFFGELFGFAIKSN
jgi:hypothetical protein